MASGEPSPVRVQGSAAPHKAGGAAYDISESQGELLRALGSSLSSPVTYYVTVCDAEEEDLSGRNTHASG